MKLFVEPLPWDTAEFGFAVATVSDLVDDPSLLPALVNSAHADGHALLYARTSEALTEEISAKVQAAGALPPLFAEQRWTYTKMLPSADSPAPEAEAAPGLQISAYGAPAPSEELLELAWAAGEHSRFALDPRFPERCFRHLYRLWMERSLSAPGSRVFVAEREGALLGMATLESKPPAARVGLIAVSAKARGQGVARRLMRAAELGALQTQCSVLSVTTQGTNAPAKALYASCGYAVHAPQWLYHLWLQNVTSRKP